MQSRNPNPQPKDNRDFALDTDLVSAGEEASLRTTGIELEAPAYFHESLRVLAGHMRNIVELQKAYRAGEVTARVPSELLDPSRPIEDLVKDCMPNSTALLDDAFEGGLFFPLPIAFDQRNSVGPYLATVDRSQDGKPYRFLEMSSFIATQPYGENDLGMLETLVRNMHDVTTKPSHSEHQTDLSLIIKARLREIAPNGTPNFFMVNTGAESVENAIKSALMQRVVKTNVKNTNEFGVVSFKSGFHGRTLGCLAVTQRKRAREGFPTFDWPSVTFPHADLDRPTDTMAREIRSMKELWTIFVGPEHAQKESSQEKFKNQLERIDKYLLHRKENYLDFVRRERSKLSEDVKQHALRAAGVLIEPVQGEGGARFCTPRFMQRLRMLTLIYDVPLIFDEVQTGLGTTGKLWAHYHYNLPAPPDAVTWAKKAQNGILFVSDDLATFFQIEKKFNTTWEGDSVGMHRLLYYISKLHLSEVALTGENAAGVLKDLSYRYPELIRNVRGSGVMWAFDVARQDLREVLIDRAFRHGLLLLRTGERGIRFYPRYDTAPHVFEDASRIMTLALEDIVKGQYSIKPMIGTTKKTVLECPLEGITVTNLTSDSFYKSKEEVQNIEFQCYENMPLSISTDTIEQTLNMNRSIGIMLRDGITKEAVAYAVGAPIEEFSDQGAPDDPHYEGQKVFFLHAMACLPTVKNLSEVENRLIDLMEIRAQKAGFSYLSTQIEERIAKERPTWKAEDKLQTHKNYLESGIDFWYIQKALF